MRAVRHERYGTTGAYTVAELEPPTPSEGEVLVRVRSSSINKADWYGMTGRPLLARPMMGVRGPKEPWAGIDLAGVVEAAGDGADFAPGDAVFGMRSRGSAYAELAVAKAVERAPAGVPLEELGAVGVAAITALQGLRDHGRLRAGMTVLVNGASGGVGTFAVQIAKALGARVTAVCSTRNVEQARELGADRVIDYTREDFTRSGERYDVIFDNAGNRPPRAYRRVLAPDGIVVVVGGPSGAFLGPLGHLARMLLAAKLGRIRAKFFIAKNKREDLATLRELMDAGTVRPIVERTYDLDRIDEAMRDFGAGHARAKFVVTV